MPVGRISNIIDLRWQLLHLQSRDKRGGTTKSLAEARPEIEKETDSTGSARFAGPLDRQFARQGLHPDVLRFVVRSSMKRASAC
jgi:hypothetical protein